MSQRFTFKITYWGVVGTLSAPLRPEEVTEKLVEAVQVLVEKGKLRDLEPGPELAASIREIVARELPFHLRSTFGGNTTCIEVETPDSLLIFDCGSGFRELGVALENRWRAAGDAARRTAHVFVTHAHMDHTFATPFFAPYYNPQNSVTIWGPSVVLNSLAAVLNPESKLSQLYFPPTYDEMKAIHDFRPLEAGAAIQIGSSRITTHPLHHPGGCQAYRVENAGRSFVFATDHEHRGVPDPGLLAFSKGADLLYTEGQYTQREYDGHDGVSTDAPMSRHGWGHSPMEACVRTAVAAGVGQLHLGHRDPRRSDRDLASLDDYLRRLIEEELQSASRPPESCTALIPYEGLQVLI
jgi:phosphoribosyl 1,2-cyclic phosphodiesterase